MGEGFSSMHSTEDNLDPDELFDCCRIVRNLVQNTRFDSEKDFCKAIRSIDTLLNQSRSTGILNYLAENKDLPEARLDRRQLKEERMKAQLLLLPEWKDEILNAEANPYLGGQIISILNLSGIEAQYDEKGNTLGNITEEQKAKFKRFTGLFSEIFNKVGLADEMEKDQIFRRALLACGDYSMYGETRGVKSNKSLIWKRGWKQYLQKTSEESFAPLRKLLDCEFSDLKELLQGVVKNRTALDLNDWMGMLVKYPEIWKDPGWNDGDSNKFIRFTDKYIYLLQKGNMHGLHHELRVLYKYYSLLKEPLNIPSGFTMEPCAVTEDEREPYFRLYNDSLQYCVYYYSDDEERPWRIELKEPLTPGMVKWAENHKFERHGDGPQLYMERLVSDEDLKDLLQEWINAAPGE
mgnify:CR=1 FL=1